VPWHYSPYAGGECIPFNLRPGMSTHRNHLQLRIGLPINAVTIYGQECPRIEITSIFGPVGGSVGMSRQ
jgi:hypothetical protein